MLLCLLTSAWRHIENPLKKMKEPVNLFKCSVTCESKNSVYLLLCRSIVSNSVVHKYAMYFSVFLGQAGFTCQSYLPLSCVRATLKYHCAPKFLCGGGGRNPLNFYPKCNRVQLLVACFRCVVATILCMSFLLEYKLAHVKWAQSFTCERCLLKWPNH